MEIKLDFTRTDSYAAIINGCEDAIISTNPSGIITVWNPTAEKLFGYTSHEITGKPIELVYPGSKSEKPLSKEFKSSVWRTKEGKLCHVSFSSFPINSSDGTLGGTAFIVKGEKPDYDYFKSLNSNDHFFSQFIEDAPVAIYTCDPTGKILQYNKLAAAMWGRCPEEGDKWCGSWKIYSLNGDEMPLSECPMAQALREERQIIGGEIIIERPDNTRHHVLPHPKPIFDRNGKLAGAINMIVDLTEATLARKNVNWLAEIVESSGDAIISKTLDGTIRSWNSSAERIFGYSSSEMIGGSVNKLLPKDRLDEEPEIIKRLGNGERVEHFDTQRLVKGGTLIDVSLSISPIFDANGKVIGASKIARNISDRKEAEKVLSDKNRELERINEELNEFAYIISHDLKAPLRAISSLSHFLVQDYADKLGTTGKNQIELLDGRIRRMSNLIQGLLEYSRIGKTKDLIREIKLKDLVEEIWTSLSPPDTINLEYEELPVIYFERVPLYHIFQNLLSNAIKFMFKGQLGVIRVAVTEKVDHLEFMVSDNGPGIDPKYYNRIFKIFQTLNARDEVESTGVGLTIVKKTIEHYGGDIWVTETSGGGATFHFTFPRLKKP